MARNDNTYPKRKSTHRPQAGANSVGRAPARGKGKKATGSLSRGRGSGDSLGSIRKSQKGQPAGVPTVGIPTVAGAGRNAHNAHKKPRSRTLDQEVASVPIERGRMTITRRNLLYGAGIVGAVAVVGGTVFAVNKLTTPVVQGDPNLSVAASNVTAADTMEQMDSGSAVSLEGNFQLPYSTLVHCNDDDVAICLVPGETGSPLNQLQMLSLSSGNLTTLLEAATCASEGYEILDARGTGEGVVWVESNVLQGSWRVFSATFSAAKGIGTATQVDSADKDWELPSLAMVGKTAYWQVMPAADGTAAKAHSALKAATAGSKDVRVVWESSGHMATDPYACADGIVITPRTTTDSSVHYKLVKISSSTDEVQDCVVLPASMKPIDAGYGPTGFTFAFDAIYSVGDGISNLGTYAPLKKATGDDYSSVPWFRWGRTPSCAPAATGNFIMVKSTQSVCGVNPNTKAYFALDVETGSDDYGDFLASTGAHANVVTFANVDSHPINGDAKQYTLVRVWKPV